MSFTRFGPNARCPVHGTHSNRRCPERERLDAEAAAKQREAALSMLKAVASSTASTTIEPPGADLSGVTTLVIEDGQGKVEP